MKLPRKEEGGKEGRSEMGREGSERGREGGKDVPEEEVLAHGDAGLAAPLSVGVAGDLREGGREGGRGG
jgi:hypothetical protein